MEIEEFKSKCSDSFRRAFVQLTQGCGRLYCINPNCGSSRQSEKHTPNEAAARLLSILQYAPDGSIDVQKSGFSMCTDPPRIYATVEDFLAELDSSPEKETLISDLFCSSEALGLSFPWEDVTDTGLFKFEPESTRQLFISINRLVDSDTISNDWQCKAIDIAKADTSLAGRKLMPRAFLMHLDNPAFYDLDNYNNFTFILSQFDSLPPEEKDVLISLISEYTPEHIRERVSTLQQFIIVKICSTDRNHDIESLFYACQVLGLFYAGNKKGNGKISYQEFYNDAVNKEVNVKDDFVRWTKIMRAIGEGRELNQRERFAFMNYPFILDAESKSRLLSLENNSMMSGQLRESFMMHMLGQRLSPFIVLEVSRENIIDDTLNQLVYNEQDLKKPLKVHFIGEEGVDEGGVQKEFFQLIIKQLFDPAFSMFNYDEEFNYYWINPNTIETSQNFELVGMLLGLAMYNSVILDVHFPMALYKKLVDHPVNIEDLKAMNPTTYEAMQTLLNFEGNVEETYCRTFQVDTEAFGEILTHDLKENGGNVPVTNENRQEYVDLYVQWTLTKSIEAQFEALKTGFLKVCDGEIYRMLHQEELELLICGNPELDFFDLEKVTEYENGFEADSTTVKAFWKVVHSLTHEDKKKFLAFCTGSDRAPVGGLKNMRFIVSRNGPDSDRLLTAHTCFNHILLPDYRTEEKMRKVILIAINNAQGFGLR